MPEILKMIDFSKILFEIIIQSVFEECVKYMKKEINIYCKYAYICIIYIYIFMFMIYTDFTVYIRIDFVQSL